MCAWQGGHNTFQRYFARRCFEDVEQYIGVDAARALDGDGIGVNMVVRLFGDQIQKRELADLSRRFGRVEEQRRVDPAAPESSTTCAR